MKTIRPTRVQNLERNYKNQNHTKYYFTRSEETAANSQPDANENQENNGRVDNS